MKKACNICLYESGLFPSHDDFQLHSFSCRFSNFIFLYGCIKLCCVYGSHFLYPYICWWAPKLALFPDYCELHSCKPWLFLNAYPWKPFFLIVEIMKIIFHGSKWHFSYFQVLIWVVTKPVALHPCGLGSRLPNSAGVSVTSTGLQRDGQMEARRFSSTWFSSWCWFRL